MLFVSGFLLLKNKCVGNALENLLLISAPVNIIILSVCPLQGQFCQWKKKQKISEAEIVIRS